MRATVHKNPSPVCPDCATEFRVSELATHTVTLQGGPVGAPRCHSHAVALADYVNRTTDRTVIRQHAAT